MAKENSVALTFYYDWLSLLEDFSDEEVGKLTIAAVMYDMTGEEPKFQDKLMQLAFKALKNSIDINKKSAKERSEQSKRAAEARWGASDAMPEHKVECGASKPMPEHKEECGASDAMPEHKADAYNTIQDKTIHDDTIQDADADATIQEHQQPLPELNGYTSGIIEEVWNACSVTRPIDSIPLFGRRANNTRLCIGHDFGGFIAVIKSLDDQYWFQEQKRQGKPLDYDWFVDPDHFPAIKEGKYKDPHNKTGGYAGELGIDWEAAECDRGELSTSA